MTSIACVPPVPAPQGAAELRERARGALLGLAVGDALGAPAENLKPSQIRDRWGRIEGFVAETPSGTDDTEYTIFSGLLLARHGSALTPAHVEGAWHEWIADRDEGPFRGAGFSERGTLENLRRGLAAPISAQHRHAWSDGLAMRAAPFGVFAAGRPAEAARLVAIDGSVSHDGEGIYGGQAVAAGVAAAMAGAPTIAVVASALAVIPDDSWTARSLRRAVAVAHRGEKAVRSAVVIGGYPWTDLAPEAVALAFGAYAAADGDFREAVLTAVNMGRDADTTAAVAGALAGATRGCRRSRPPGPRRSARREAAASRRWRADTYWTWRTCWYRAPGRRPPHDTTTPLGRTDDTDGTHQHPRGSTAERSRGRRRRTRPTRATRTRRRKRNGWCGWEHKSRSRGGQNRRPPAGPGRRRRSRLALRPPPSRPHARLDPPPDPRTGHLRRAERHHHPPRPHRPQPTPEPLRLGPSDDAEWAALTAEALLRAADGTALGDLPRDRRTRTAIDLTWNALADEVAAATDKAPEIESAEIPLRARISVRAGLGNLATGLRPPATGHDNPHYFDDAACVRACVLAVAHPGAPRLAADLAEFDARYTQDGDGVHGARAMAAAVSLALTGATVETCVSAALAELPAQTEIGRNARHALHLAQSADSAFALIPALEHDIVDHVYSYGIAAAETVPVALALATAAQGRIAEAIPAAACLSRVADSAPALVGALTGALGGSGSIPATWQAACRTLSGCALPRLTGTDLVELAGLLEAAQAPLPGG